jgi:hypothetical protein
VAVTAKTARDDIGEVGLVFDYEESHGPKLNPGT